MLQAVANHLVEGALTASLAHPDPAAEPEVDVLVTDPAGIERRVPAFRAGDQVWRWRYSSPLAGRHAWRSVCADAGDAGLHGVTGALEVTPYLGEQPLYRHGPVRVEPGARYLSHADGTPFFWLGDTWWYGLSGRLRWPDEWRALVADRRLKGFTLVQMVAGLFPDAPAYDARGWNEAGYAWQADWAAPNPGWFDLADLRVSHLVEQGLVPAIVGCWGYYLPWLGVERMKRHWRYLIARWAALPVVWILAGEGAMPWYLSTTRDADAAAQREGWTEVARYVQATDPFDRPVTIHPTQVGRDQVTDPAVLDCDMLQTGHGDRNSLGPTLRLHADACGREPVMPVVEGEVCYEGIGEACRQEVQRLMAWAAFLSGAKGFTYGANGLWQVNREGAPFGPSPHGMAWGDLPWQDAAALPGSGQLQHLRRLLERYEWWRLEPRPAAVEPHATPDRPDAAIAGGIDQDVLFVYLPFHAVWRPRPVLHGLASDTVYRVFLSSPVDGHEHPLGELRTDSQGDLTTPGDRAPLYQDWLLVAERC